MLFRSQDITAFSVCLALRRAGWPATGRGRAAARRRILWRCSGATAPPSATPASTTPSLSSSPARLTGSSGSGTRRATAQSPPSGLMAARLGCIQSLLAPDLGTQSLAREEMVCAKAGQLRKLGSHGGPYLQSKQVHTISVRCHWLRFHVLHMAHKPA